MVGIEVVPKPTPSFTITTSFAKIPIPLYSFQGKGCFEYELLLPMPWQAHALLLLQALDSCLKKAEQSADNSLPITGSYHDSMLCLQRETHEKGSRKGAQITPFSFRCLGWGSANEIAPLRFGF